MLMPVFACAIMLVFKSEEVEAVLVIVPIC